MKAIVCLAPRQIALEDRPAPARAEGELLVRIRRAGICGTDYHIFEGTHPFLAYPRLIGHELSATVEEAPAGSRFRPGDDVVVNPYLACGACHACRDGMLNCCMRIAVLGVHCDGGMCERLSLPEGNLLPAAGLSLDAAALSSSWRSAPTRCAGPAPATAAARWWSAPARSASAPLSSPRSPAPRSP